MPRVRAIVGGAAAAFIAAGLWYVSRPPRPVDPVAPVVSTTTAAVTVGNVTQRVAIAGSLGYAGTYSVVSQLPAGILTATAGSGTVVDRGERLLRSPAPPPCCCSAAHRQAATSRSA